MSGAVSLEFSNGGALAEVTLRRPEKRNALSLEVMEGVCGHFRAIAARREVRVVMVRGEGVVFCSGLDLLEASRPGNGEPIARGVMSMLRAVFECRAVTIALVQGAAVAGGAGLMSACDLVVASDNARVGYPEVRRGLVAASVMTLLRRQAGERAVRELLLTGELVSAARAREMGLVTRVVPENELEAEGLRLAESCLKGGPEAIAATKALIETLASAPLSAELDQALATHLAARDSDESAEGTAAFLEKRPPRWEAKP